MVLTIIKFIVPIPDNAKVLSDREKALSESEGTPANDRIEQQDSATIPTEQSNISSDTRQPGRCLSRSRIKQSKVTRRNGMVTVRRKPQTSTASGEDRPQLSEEELFHLLITRLRQREDEEAAAVALRNQMKNEIRGLTSENETLKVQVQQYESKQNQQESYLCAHREQVERWRTKLTKLKRFLNGLGKDYETLRNESNQLKACQASLVEDKLSLITDIHDMKSTVEHLSTKSSAYPGQLRDLNLNIQSIEQSLRSAEEKVSYYQDNLVKEQSRVSKLETYIQNSSNKHVRQINLLEGMQTRVIDNIGSLDDHIHKQWNSLQTQLQSMLSPTIENCMQIVKARQENESADVTELKRLNDLVAAITSQLVVPCSHNI
jgi:chromosome segregation ATPase